ncbi:MAG: LamG-like jellyroll fold domain-containing protein [Cytophagaceae bacterium]
MKRLLLPFLLFCQFAYSQNVHHYTIDSLGLEIIDSAAVPYEIVLKDLFSELDFSEVHTGLLLEKGFNAINTKPYHTVREAKENYSFEKPRQWDHLYEVFLSNALREADRWQGNNGRARLVRLNDLLKLNILPFLKDNVCEVSPSTAYLIADEWKELYLEALEEAENFPNRLPSLRKWLSHVEDPIASFMEVWDLSSYTSLLNGDNLADKDKFLRLIHAMNEAAIDQGVLPLPEHDAVDQQLSETNNEVPLAVLFMDYNSLDYYALDKGLFTYDGTHLHDVPDRASSPYEEHSLFALAAGKDKVNQNVQFKLSAEFYLTNSSKTIRTIELDAGEGLGFREVNFDDVINISYSDPGKKNVKILLRFTDCTVAIAHCKLEVEAPEFGMLRFGPVADEVWRNIFLEPSPEMPLRVGCDVHIAYGCGNTQLTKPLIVVKGFEPDFLDEDQKIDYTDLIDQLEIENDLLKEEIENNSYDLVFIDWHDATENIIANAHLLKGIIGRINRQKAGDEPLVVMGLSMGGLVGRIALAEMERDNIDHNTRLLITFDTPHQGANVPLGFQFMVEDLAKQPVLSLFTKIGKVNKVRQSPAAVQMLAVRTSGTNQFFINYLNQLGYPQKVRTIAISNGTFSGNGQGFEPNDNILLFRSNTAMVVPAALPRIALTTLGGTSWDIDFEVNALPDASQGQRLIYKGRVQAKILHQLPLFPSNTWVYSISNRPLDNAPGGHINISADLDDSFLYEGGINVNNFCYIPTVSSLDLRPPANQNLFQEINPNQFVDDGVTPFKRVAGPLGLVNFTPPLFNEFHVTFSNNNHNLLMQELILYEREGVSESLSNSSFNYGRGIQSFIGNLNINEEGSLYINANRPLGAQDSGLPVPEPGAKYTVFLRGFNDCNLPVGRLNVNDGGNLIMGDHQTSGDVVILSGAVLQLFSGGSLNIMQGSRLIVESGGTLVVRHNSILQLNGVIEVRAGAFICIEDFEGIAIAESGKLDIDARASYGTNPNVGIVAACRHCDILDVESPLALEFDGIDDFIYFEKFNTLGARSFIFEAYITLHTEDRGKRIPIVSNLEARGSISAHGYEIGIKPDGFLYYTYNGFDYIMDRPRFDTYDFFDGNCYHIVVKMSPMSVEMTINSHYRGSFLHESFPSPVGHEWAYIGYSPYHNAYFKGYLKEVRVWFGNADNIERYKEPGSVRWGTFGLRSLYQIEGDQPDFRFTDFNPLSPYHGILGEKGSFCSSSAPRWVEAGEYACGPYPYMPATPAFSNEALVYSLPNPFIEEAEVMVEGIAEEYVLRITDAQGNVYYERNMQPGEKIIIGTELPQGMYIVKAVGKDKTVVGKLLKL